MFHDRAAPITPRHNAYFCWSQTYFPLLQQLPQMWSSLNKVLQQIRTSTLKYYKKDSKIWGFLQFWVLCSTQLFTDFQNRPVKTKDRMKPEIQYSLTLTTAREWKQEFKLHSKTSTRNQIMPRRVCPESLASFIKFDPLLKIHNMVVIHKTIQLCGKVPCCMKNTKFL